MKAFIRKFRRDQRGAVAIIIAGAITGLAGLTALSVDIGTVARAQRVLQNSADLAAMAGAANIYAGTGVATANSYSAAASDHNATSGLTVTMASGYPALRCLSSTGVACPSPSNANAIVVRQQASVPLFFAPVFGINSVNISATSTAGASGGKPDPADVMIILDTTASMNTSDANCSISGATRESCALAGVRILLQLFWPSVDQVGLMVFPGLTNTTQVGYEYDCSNSPTPAIAKYSASTVVYKIIPLSTDYKGSDTTTTLNTASNLVKAARGGASNCAQGLTAVGGVGTFYADVITAAQSELTTNGRSGVQKVIILLSDGDASATSTNMSASKVNNQCHEAITAASAAATAGTWIYSIAYGASTSSTGSCSTDTTTHISACSTMQQIASDTAKFYSTDTGHSNLCQSTVNSMSELVSIFNSVGSSVTVPRLLPDGTS